MLVTYCDSCGILVQHPKTEVKVHCPDCFKQRQVLVTRKISDPLPYAERMNCVSGDPLVEETSRQFRQRGRRIA